MPIDPSIPLGIRPLQLQTPHEALAQVLQGQKAASELRTLRQQEADQRAIRQVLVETGGDIEQALPRLRQISPNAALTLETELARRQQVLAATESEAAQRANAEAQRQRAAYGLDTDKQQRALREFASIDTNDPQAPALWQQTYEASEAQGIPPSWLARFRPPSTPEGLARSVALARAMLGQTTPATRMAQIRTVNKQGQEVIAFVPEESGAEYPVPPPASSTAQPNETTLAVRAAAGDPEAIAALRFLREQHPPAPREDPLVQVFENGQMVWRPRSQAGGKPSAAPGAAGGEGGAVKLTGAQQEDIATMLTVQDLSKEVETLGTKINWAGVGPVAGRAAPFVSALGFVNKDEETLRNFIGNIQGTIAKLRGGTAFSVQEKAMLDSYTPTLTDHPLKIQAKLQSLNTFMTAKRENMLRVARGEYELAPAPSVAPKKANPFRK